MRNSKLIFFSLLAALFLSSCWAPRCPMESCHIKMEHRHSTQVSGTFSGKSLTAVPRIHFLWDSEKGEKITETGTVPKTSKRKMRKKFPWERW
ncbi:MAG: hypothetical protein LCH67_02940 [Bacteroidetes bacterium]|nr:hypothetical protein [Bacteroidota bacterium]